MADIELVIKIPEGVFKEIVSADDDSHLSRAFLKGSYLYFKEALQNGTPLPKRHGRLIDADALKKDDEVTEWLSLDAIRTGKTLKRFSELFIKKIDAKPTIIEADKESEDKEWAD